MQAQKKQKKIWPWFLGAVVVGMIALIVWIEEHLPYQFRFSLLYFIPILLAARFLGAKAGIGAAILCSSITLTLDLYPVREYVIWFTPYVNALMILTVYVAAVFLDREYRHESKIARTDSLTGLFNRKAFFELLESEVERCQRYRHPVSIAYIDVDDFKLVNDRYGHNTGDRFLKTLANTLNKGSRATDRVARLGGDEFAILMPETDEYGAKSVIERLTKLTQMMNKHLFSITVSIGVVTFHKAPESAENMISEADKLMYLGKQKGKNRTETHIVR